MTTTTSTTSSTSSTSTVATANASATAASASTVVSSATQQLLTSLSSGSGVDTASLVTALVQAQYAGQTSALATKSDTLSAEISGLGSMKSAISNFSTALNTLVTGGTLTTQPTVSNTSVLTATAIPGAVLGPTVVGSQLAGAQSVKMAGVADPAAVIGTGTLTLTLGSATYNSNGTAMTGFTAGSASPVTIDITDGSSSLNGIAAAINAKNAGITAAVATGSDGKAYLSLTGAQGKAQAFTLDATSTTGDLSGLTVGVPASGTTNTSVITAVARDANKGTKLPGLSSSVIVSQLASGQSARTSTAVTDRTATTFGAGSLTLTLGTATYSSDGTAMTGFTAGSGSPVTIDIADGDSSLNGIAAAINAKGAGVTASIVTDADGSAFLSLKGATGKTQAFTLQGSTTALSALNVGLDSNGNAATGTTITGQAQNAKLNVDGVAVERTSNTVSDLLAGVKLQLTSVSTVPVTLGNTPPTDALSGAVSDFVGAYNEVIATVMAQTDPITGPLRADPNANSLLQALKGLTLTKLLPNAAGGTPTTLSELGVATNKDGTLQVNSTTLTNALATWPDSVEAMFAVSTDPKTGIAQILTALSDMAIKGPANIYDATQKIGLDAAVANYTADQAKVAQDQDDLATQSAATKTRLTQQYADMNSKVSAYKSTQTFLTNQIAQWNKSGS